VQRTQLESHLESDARTSCCLYLRESFTKHKKSSEKKQGNSKRKLMPFRRKLEEKMDESVDSLKKKLEEKVGSVQADLTSRIGRIEMSNFYLEHKLEREIKESTQKKEESPFIWRISGFRRILYEARRSTQIESAPFYTEENGYK
ncbi:hypothetical protein OS493_025035, partial [Desmophyllum pertusum]